MILTFGHFAVDANERRLRYNGSDVAVQPLIFDLLLYFLQRPNTLVTRDDLVRQVWKGIIVGDGSITQAVSLLRRLLRRDAETANSLRTVWGRGYRLVPTGALGGGANEQLLPSDEEPFVDPEGLLGRLCNLLDDVKSGIARVLLVSGEPGIGKSRTCRELQRIAQAAGIPVLSANIPEAGGLPSFWAWEQLRRQGDASRGHEAEPGQEDPTAMPPVGALSGRPAELLPQDQDRRRFEMYERVATFWADLSGRGPLVLVMDDVHRADVDTLDLLDFVAERVATCPILIVATMRGGDNKRDAAWQRSLGALLRRPWVRSEHLRRFGLRGVAEFVSAITEDPCDEERARSLLDRSGGNPFLLGVLLRETQDTSAESARQVSADSEVASHSAIDRHLDVVTQECRDVLAGASVIGREFDSQLLAEVLDRQPSDVLDRLDEAMDAELVTHETNGRYQFVHALIRDALYEGLSTSQRIELHARVGRSIERCFGTGEDFVEALADHFYRAAAGGHATRAFEYSLRAAQVAARSSAFREAMSHYHRANELAPRADVGEEALLTVQVGWAEAAANAGDYEALDREARGALIRARRLDDVVAFARAAHCLSFGEHGDLANPEIEQAVEEALQRYDREDELRVRLMTRLADAKWFSAPPAVSRRFAAEAVDAARRVGEPDSLTHALTRAHRIHMGTASAFAYRTELARELSETIPRIRNPAVRLDGRWHLLGDAVERGDRIAFYQRVDSLLREAARSPHPFADWYGACARAARLHLEARFDEAESEAHRGTTLPGPGAYFRAAVFGLQLQGIRLSQGRFGEYADELRAHLQGDRPVAAQIYLALADAMHGRRSEAQGVFASVSSNDLAALPRDVNWMIGIVGLADLCVLLGDREHAATIESHLLPFADQHAWLGASWFHLGAVARQLGLLADMLGQQDEAIRRLRTAVERDARMGAPAYVAQDRFELAKVLLQRRGRGARAEAMALLREVAADAARFELSHLGAKAKKLRES